jgi:hypothetical protein
MSENNGTSNGRDPRGWFAKGNRIASGNPINKRMRELRQKLLDCATEADIEELYRSLMESARSGDTAAARLLLDHLVGKPKETVEVSAEGGSPPLATIVGVILAALGDDQDARVRVAAAFHARGWRRLEGDDGGADGA